MVQMLRLDPTLITYVIQEQIEDLKVASAEYEARQAERTSADQDWFVNKPVQVGQRL